MNKPYNPSDINSIISYAKRLEGTSLRAVLGNIVSPNIKGKGKFGQLLESAYFQYSLNSRSECDFSEVNMELKSTPLKQLKIGKFVSKERLVLSIIDYEKIVNQEFEGSSMLLKNKILLLVCYLYEKDTDVLDLIIPLVEKWNLPEEDLITIKRDWEFIKQKVLDGKAHEISEGDTLYLGACTKGANSNSIRKQPYSEIEAKQRAFSFKQGYLNHIIAKISGNDYKYGRLLKSPEIIKKQSLEDYVISLFSPYIGENVPDILTKLNVPISRTKDYYARISKSILRVNPKKDIEEFNKAEIIFKTIRVNKNGKIKEEISLPAFKYEDIYNEEEWDDSLFKEQVSRKFFFIFFKTYDDVVITDSTVMILEKVMFWNMPANDIKEIRKIWEATRYNIINGDIVKEILPNKRITYFTKSSENPVGHIRPHANVVADTYSLPVADNLTGVTEYTKHSLWLNKDYVKRHIY